MQLVTTNGFYPCCYVEGHGKRQGLFIQDDNFNTPTMEWYFENRHLGPSICQISETRVYKLDFHDHQRPLNIPFEATAMICKKVALYPHPIPEARILARRVWDEFFPTRDPWKARDDLIIFLALEYGLTFPILESVMYIWGDYNSSRESYRKILLDEGYPIF